MELPPLSRITAIEELKVLLALLIIETRSLRRGLPLPEEPALKTEIDALLRDVDRYINASG